MIFGLGRVGDFEGLLEGGGVKLRGTGLGDLYPTHVWGTRQELVPGRRKQFVRSACGCTPACGSEVRADGPVVYGTAEPCPFEVVASMVEEVGWTSCEPMSQKRDMGHPDWR
jgi:hypothetical protein